MWHACTEAKATPNTIGSSEMATYGFGVRLRAAWFTRAAVHSAGATRNADGLEPALGVLPYMAEVVSGRGRHRQRNSLPEQQR